MILLICEVFFKNGTGGAKIRRKASLKMPRLTILCVLCIVLCASCADLKAKLHIMEGNFYYSQGLSNQAIAAYLKAASYPQAKAYAEFGLGSVYYALDERQAALERFAAAAASAKSLLKQDDPELLYRIRYNEGIVRFENGRYDEAAAHFRAALEANGAHVGAKRNLELSLLAQNESESGTGGGAGDGEGEERSDPGNEVLFQYVREKESRQWQSREQIEDTDGNGPDY